MSNCLVPSARLPPIKTITTCSPQALLDAIDFLRTTFTPEVRGSRRRRTQVSDAHTNLIIDSFEKAFVQNWLTRLISQAELWESFSHLIQEAASILALFSGTSAAGIIHRTFIFPTPDRPPIRIKIRDLPLENRDFNSVGAQTWGGACVLSEMIAESPKSFGLEAPCIRVLELGSGTGLVGLTVASVCDSNAEVIVSDFYPPVLHNLQVNIAGNFPKGSNLSVHQLDWSTEVSSSFTSPFDVVFGADVVYEPHHARCIKNCLRTLLRKPTGDSDPLFHLIMPLRALFSVESLSVETSFIGQGLVIKSKEIILCDAEVGSIEGVEYAYYKIGWSKAEHNIQ